MKKHLRPIRILYTLAALIVVSVTLPLFTKLALHRSVRDRIYTNINSIPKTRVAVVLGTRVHPSGKPSWVLQDRLDTAIALYKAGKVEKLLMSGDNRFHHYNEPERMMEYATKHGVQEDDVAADYAGRRTYDTVYRARHIFGLDEFIVVSQEFHLDRTLFLCDKLGVQAYGMASEKQVGRQTRVREALACVGAVVDVYIRHPRPVMGKREKI